MGSNLSITHMLAQLEMQVAHHQERQAFHEQQTLFHQEQAALHGNELKTATERLETFRAASAAAGEFLDRVKAGAPPAPDPNASEDLGKGTPLTRLIARVVEGKAPDEPFGANAVSEEIQQRWGGKLRRKVDPRSVSSTLSRWAAAGHLHRTRDGRSHQEALYARRG